MEFKLSTCDVLVMELPFMIFTGLILSVNMQKIQDPGMWCKICIKNVLLVRKCDI